MYCRGRGFNCSHCKQECFDESKVFIVVWSFGGYLTCRAYSNRESAENMVKWCKDNQYNYNFLEETIDREILN